MADLDLLVDYVTHLQTGLERADNLTREGELGKAIWAYLNVLEVDPDNAIARRQVGEVATAVRQFDATAPGRRWLSGLRGNLPGESRNTKWLWGGLATVLVIVAFLLGYGLASLSGGDGSGANPPQRPPSPNNRIGP
jgi:hypothetical protein